MGEMVRGLWRSNPTWGKSRIRDELRKIGIEVSDSTVWRYRPLRCSCPPSQSWRAFLDNQVRDLVAIDFFVVPRATFRVLYERHLLRVLRGYASYYHASRTHRSLDEHLTTQIPVVMCTSLKRRCQIPVRPGTGYAQPFDRNRPVLPGGVDAWH